MRVSQAPDLQKYESNIKSQRFAEAFIFSIKILPKVDANRIRFDQVRFFSVQKHSDPIYPKTLGQLRLNSNMVISNADKSNNRFY